MIKDDQLSVFTSRNLAEVTWSDAITFDWHSEERRLTRFHLHGQQLCKLWEQKKVYEAQQLLQYWFAWDICVLDTYMEDVKNVMWRHLSIAGLHVTSRRPCWWSRTKAFLSMHFELYFRVNSSKNVYWIGHQYDIAQLFNIYKHSYQ